MAFGDSEIKDAVLAKLDKWLSNPPDYDDVEQAYKKRGKYQAMKAAYLRDIERLEEEIIADVSNKPRSNETRIKKQEATKEARDTLAWVEQQIAEIENHVKFLEFKKSMFSAAMYRMKLQMDL